MSKSETPKAPAPKIEHGAFRATFGLAALTLVGLAAMQAWEEQQKAAKEEKPKKEEAATQETGEVPEEVILKRFNVNEMPVFMSEKDRKKKEKKAKKAKGIIDEVTGNIITGSAMKVVTSGKYPGPRVTFMVNGKMFEGRKSCVINLLRAVIDFERVNGAGRELDLTWMLRTNDEQRRIHSDSYGTCKPSLRHPIKSVAECLEKAERMWKKEQIYAAAKDDKGFHLTGCVADVGTGLDANGVPNPKLISWDEIQPFLEARGFIGGFRNGITRGTGDKTTTDAFHFTVPEEVSTPAEEARQAELRAFYCRDYAAHCAVMDARQKALETTKPPLPKNQGAARGQ